MNPASSTSPDLSWLLCVSFVSSSNRVRQLSLECLMMSFRGCRLYREWVSRIYSLFGGSREGSSQRVGEERSCLWGFSFSLQKCCHFKESHFGLPTKLSVPGENGVCILALNLQYLMYFSKIFTYLMQNQVKDTCKYYNGEPCNMKSLSKMKSL